MASNVLDNFELPKDTSRNFKAKCLQCASTISGSLKITSNFATHIKVNISILFNIISEEKISTYNLQIKTQFDSYSNYP